MKILYIEPILITPLIFAIIAAICFIIGIFLLIKGFNNCNLFIIIIAMIILIFSYIVPHYKIDSGKNKLYIYLEEKQDLNEFFQKYKIIKQKDNMFIVEER